ncbi:hypothetical protein IT414_00815 [bacterium]|nr:hypothetical protein [bacterium]
MADDTSVVTPPAPTVSTDASPFTPMAEANALGTPPTAVAGDDAAAMPTQAVSVLVTAESTDSTPPASPFTPPEAPAEDSATMPNPIPMPPDLDEKPEVSTPPAPPLNPNPASPAPAAQPDDAAAIDDAVAKLGAAKADDAVADAKPPVAPPEPPKMDAPKTDKKAEAKKPAAPSVSSDNPRLKEHIDKVTAPVDTMIANAQSMDNRELVALLQKQKEALTQKAREDFARNDKLKSERLSKAATVVSEILQTRSAGQKVTEQVLYEFDPATASQSNVAEFPNADMALETARAVYQLVGAKEPNDLQESEPDENGNKVATATRETDIGVQLKEWVSLASDGSIAQMRISTVGEI